MKISCLLVEMSKFSCPILVTLVLRCFFLILTISWLAPRPIDMAPISDEMSEVKVALLPLAGLMEKINNMVECEVPSVSMVERAYEIFTSLSDELRIFIWNQKDLKNYANLYTFFLMDWPRNKVKMDPSMFMQSSINRTMMTFVERYHLNKYNFSPCSDLSKAPMMAGPMDVSDKMTFQSVHSSMKNYVDRVGPVQG